MTLEVAAFEWLRFQKRCMLVTEERGLQYWYRPDVIGVMPSRHLIEIEIKRTYSDFIANNKKNWIANRNHIESHDGQCRPILDRYPQQFYFLVPTDLVRRILPELPPWSGLMHYPGPARCICVEKVAPPNKDARKLSLKQISKMVRFQSAAYICLRRNLEIVSKNYTDLIKLHYGKHEQGTVSDTSGQDRIQESSRPTQEVAAGV